MTARASCTFAPPLVFHRSSKIFDDQSLKVRPNQCFKPTKAHINIMTCLKDTSNNKNNSPSSSSTKNTSTGRKGILSSTARESAVIAEWEPISELERRTEEGVYYEHFNGPSKHGDQNRQRRGKEVQQNYEDDDGRSGIQTVNAIFCGYRVTKEEFLRLRSANPGDFRA